MGELVLRYWMLARTGHWERTHRFPHGTPFNLNSFSIKFCGFDLKASTVNSGRSDNEMPENIHTFKHEQSTEDFRKKSIEKGLRTSPTSVDWSAILEAEDYDLKKRINDQAQRRALAAAF